MKNRWGSFTDNEIYILKRQSLESSFEIMMGDRYDSSEKQLHSQLINELTIELRNREYRRYYE